MLIKCYFIYVMCTFVTVVMDLFSLRSQVFRVRRAQLVGSRAGMG